jgi:hypothetical protein
MVGMDRLSERSFKRRFARATAMGPPIYPSTSAASDAPWAHRKRVAPLGTERRGAANLNSL